MGNESFLDRLLGPKCKICGKRIKNFIHDYNGDYYHESCFKSKWNKKLRNGPLTKQEIKMLKEKYSLKDLKDTVKIEGIFSMEGNIKKIKFLDVRRKLSDYDLAQIYSRGIQTLIMLWSIRADKDEMKKPLICNLGEPKKIEYYKKTKNGKKIKIKNKERIKEMNKESKKTMVKEYAEGIKMLKEALKKYKNGKYLCK